MDKAHAGEIAVFIAKLHARQAVLMDGKKWAIATRLPFPQEAVWADIKRQRDSE